MRELIRRAWHIIRQRRFEEDLAEEMEFHRAMTQHEIEDRGVNPREAAFAARRAFGSVALAADRSRDVWIPRALQGLGQDFRLAVRTLFANRLVSFIAILSLALGIGANTAIFSLVNSLLLRALPVAQPERLAMVTGGGSPNQAYPYPTWEEIRKRADAFGGLCASLTTRFDLARGGEMQFVDGLSASGDFFATLGVPALLGRTFTAADDVRGGGPDGAVAVISYAFWQRHFGGAVSVIGTPVTIERVPFTIIGVTPPDFFGVEVGRAFDVAVPITADALMRGRGTFLDQFSWRLTVIVRLKPGESIDHATSTLRGLQPRIREAAMPLDWPARSLATFLTDPLTLVPAALGTSGLRHQYQRPLVILLVVVGLVLLIACANIANLLLARATARRHELSVRRALGASRWRIARQFLVESLVLSAAGTATGLAFAAWGSRAIVAQLSPPFVSRVALDLSIDWRVLAFTGAMAVTTVVLFSIGPAFRATQTVSPDALKAHGRGSVNERRAGFSGGLVVVQMALSLVLVVAAGLFLRTFGRLASRPLGFDAGRVLVLNVDVTRAHIEPANRLAFYLRLPRAVATVPGVAFTGGSLMTPVSGSGSNRFVDVPGAPSLPQMERLVVVNFVTPGWFAVYGIAVRAGRDIVDTDTDSTQPVVVVNEAFARRFYPGRNPVGASLAAPAPGRRDVPPLKVIVGVVADTVYSSLRESPQPTLFLPAAQWDFRVPFGGGSVSVRAASGSPATLAHGIAAALATVDRDLAFTVRPLTEQVDASLTQERLVAILSGFFGALALLLAGLGLYGVTAYAVFRCRREIGIRMALGAAPAGVVRLVLSRVTMLVGLGVAIGAGVSLWASRFVASLLYGLEPRDPATLVGAVLALSAVGAFAAWLPARRASRIDPAVVLRCE
ncbi:MAG: ABC transporter permease [Acidobacteria bacterium]|nr:ABC transporter permease [Acidobacteriota bacterium]